MTATEAHETRTTYIEPSTEEFDRIRVRMLRTMLGRVGNKIDIGEEPGRRWKRRFEMMQQLEKTRYG